MCSALETEKAPGEIYLESDLVIRALRDLFGNDIVKIICDSDAMVRKLLFGPWNDEFLVLSPGETFTLEPFLEWRNT